MAPLLKRERKNRQMPKRQMNSLFINAFMHLDYQTEYHTDKGPAVQSISATNGRNFSDFPIQVI
jgi:hypothetical protein